MPELWIPGIEGPHEELVSNIHRQIVAFLKSKPVDTAEVEIDLRDGPTVRLESISAEPGYGFVTLTPAPGEDDGGGEEWIVPVGSILRIRLRAAEHEVDHVGFALPEQTER